MHKVLVNRIGGLSLPRKSVVMLTDHPDMPLDVYRGRKTTTATNLGPLLFNVFINDIFYFLKKGSIYNYATDETESYSNKYLYTTKDVLESESIICLDWFVNNKIRANPDKFQAIMLGKSGFENCKSLNIGSTEIKCEDSVNLLGVTFDYMLSFDQHISNTCKKAARQINLLFRPSSYLFSATKILIYKSFINSTFNYYPPVWHFCSKTSSVKMKKLQCRALCLVFNDFKSSYVAPLKKVNMPILHLVG